MNSHYPLYSVIYYCNHGYSIRRGYDFLYLHRVLTVWYEAHFLHIHTFVGAKTHAGILAILYLASVYILIYKRRRSQGLQKPILAVSTIMFVMGLLVSLRTLKNTRKETYLEALNFRRAQIGFTASVVRQVALLLTSSPP